MPIASPEIPENLITLPGRTPNAAPESWQKVERSPTSASDLNEKADTPEILVRNVSKPTLKVFLPSPAKATGAAMVIAPGSGFMRLAIGREGYDVAERLAERGIVAFVLKYRLAPAPADAAAFETEFQQLATQIVENQRGASDSAPVDVLLPQAQRDALDAAEQDIAAAMRYVRINSSKWHVSPDRVGLLGFSAGAIAAITVASSSDASSRPDILASLFGLLPHRGAISPSAPPAFIAVAADDIYAARGGPGIYAAWRAAGVPAELHVFEHGQHGFDLVRHGTTSDQWPGLFDMWLAKHGFERASP